MYLLIQTSLNCWYYNSALHHIDIITVHKLDHLYVAYI